MHGHSAQSSTAHPRGYHSTNSPAIQYSTFNFYVQYCSSLGYFLGSSYFLGLDTEGPIPFNIY